MSSCSSEDVKNRNVKIDSYRVGLGCNPPFFIGNSYAWIIIDWKSLNDENKSIFVDYNSGKKQIPLSDYVDIHIINKDLKVLANKSK